MRGFKRDTSGNFAIYGAVAAIPLMLGVATAIDVSMAYRNSSGLQNALDSGLLAAGQYDGTLKEKKEIVGKFLQPHIERLELSGMSLAVDITGDDERLEGTVSAKYTTNFMKLVGRPTMDITVTSAVAVGSTGALDVALVLDNTASLDKDGLQAVKDAATTFSDSIFKAGTKKSAIQMAVVPFAGSVNVGRGFARKYLDTKADSYWHGKYYEWKWIAKINDGCVPNWGTGTTFDPGSGTVESHLMHQPPSYLGEVTRFAYQELIGIRPAHAGVAQTHGLPAGYEIVPGGGCTYIQAPEKINHFDLFNGIKNVDWGGCVEARESPYDTDDTVPKTSKAATLFTPYFWPDEPDAYEDWVPIFHNNYMPDVDPEPWTPAGYAVMDYWGRPMSVLKYNGVNISMGADGQYKSGPNFGCPNELLKLDANHGQVTSSIATMSLVPGGGTVISEGVAWGWRVLSPREPFTEGSTDADAKRIMVVMSDGENQISRNPQNPGKWGADHTGSPTISDYNAYGYLLEARLNNGTSQTFAQAEAELDKRTLAICDNAKKDGVEIYTILFKSNSARAIDTLKKCASEEKFFFKAIDANALSATFGSIAASIGRYRLVK